MYQSKAIAVFLSMTLMALPIAGAAEIESANMSGQTASMGYWAKLPDVKGWHHDERLLRPDGITNGDDVAISSRIFYGPDKGTIADLISSDKNWLRGQWPDIIIRDEESLATSIGYKMLSVSYASKKKPAWNRVFYGKEKDKFGNEHYIAFVLSASSESEYNKAMPIFEQMIRDYK